MGDASTSPSAPRRCFWASISLAQWNQTLSQSIFSLALLIIFNASKTQIFTFENAFMGWTKTRPSEANDASFGDFFIFLFFLTTFHFFTLLVPPSSSSVLPPDPSFFFNQHCPNHLESVKVHFSSILTDQATDQPTDQQTDKASHGDADASKNLVSLQPVIYRLGVHQKHRTGVAIVEFPSGTPKKLP